mmetsp:Transcript_34176/g.73873  ORF Transcript_34176/g.73873 Transcript_34176/m.73873 type:complete len:395 (+) Transcript_34176:404-1588(+)
MLHEEVLPFLSDASVAALGIHKCLLEPEHAVVDANVLLGALLDRLQVQVEADEVAGGVGRLCGLGHNGVEVDGLADGQGLQIGVLGDAADARLHEACPAARLGVLARAHDVAGEVVRVADEEVGGLEQPLPALLLLLQDLLDDLQTEGELALHYLEAVLADVEGGVHGRVSGRDNRHQVFDVVLRGPHHPLVGYFGAGSVLLDVVEHDGVGPAPGGVVLEKAEEQRGGGGVGEQLADEGHQYVAVYAPQVAQLVPVQAPLLGPLADAAQHHQEVGEGLLAHQLEDHVRHARAVERLLRGLVQAHQDAVVQDVDVAGHGVLREAREEQVDVDLSEVEGYNGHEGLLDRGHVGDLGAGGEVVLEVGEEVLAGAEVRRHADCVDVGPDVAHAQPMRA